MFAVLRMQEVRAEKGHQAGTFSGSFQEFNLQVNVRLVVVVVFSSRVQL
jgi:hypothetical protein